MMKINPTKTIDELITALSFIVDVENNRKIYHSWRVAILASEFAKNRVSLKKRREIFYASLLHDIGAVGLIRHIIYFLKKADKHHQPALLSHPIIGAQLVSIIPEMIPVAKLIFDHHEWFNGQGYPEGKSNKDIPFSSQLIRIADSIDIIFQFNRYGKLKTIIKKISNFSNKEFSKRVFDLAINNLKKRDFFTRISNRNKIPETLYRIKSDIGQIPVKNGVDAIGTTLEFAAQIIDMKHPFTSGHSLRVSRYALTIALNMKLEHDEITRIRWAGLLHDIGKLTTPRKILEKAGTLTYKEYLEVKKHPEITHRIMNTIPSLKEIIPIAVGHHEYYNGAGYPLGLKRKESPLGARILTLCDAFDAMTSNRPYRKPLIPEDACQRIIKLSGTQFDPEIVRYALPILKNLRL